MSGSALVLAAHGSHQDPSINALVRGYANRLAETRLFDEVAAAFHQGDPSFAVVLDTLAADEVTVVPVMTSEGYFSETVLPRELAKNARYGRVNLRRTVPVGLHPGLVPLVARRAGACIDRHDLDAEATTVFVVGHGTRRNPKSRVATVKLVSALCRLGSFSEVMPAFLDEDPRVEAIRNRASRRCVVVVPFLIGNGPHASRDVPARVGLAAVQRAETPRSGWVGDCFVVCDAAVGTDAGLVDLIVDLTLTSRL